MSTIAAAEIQVGDVILPPERELRLWMRRHAAEHKMSEAALNLTVVEIQDQDRDKRGPWLRIKTNHAPEWGNSHPFSFKARPNTPWPLIHREVA